MATLNTKTSIVDYLKSKGQDSSFGARANLASQYGIKNYTGSAQQNTQLLNLLRQGSQPKAQTSAKKTAKTSAKKTATTPAKTAQQQYGIADIDFSKYRTQSATIEDIAKKYGFDFSREYAQRIAEQEAQRRRAEVESQRARVEQATQSAKTDLEHDFFNQFLQQQQAITNSGLNAGLEMDRYNRLDMSRQHALADILQTAELQNQDLDRMMQIIAEEQGLRTETLYDQRMQFASQLLQQYEAQRQAENLAMLQAELQQRGQNISLTELAERMGLQREQFDWQKLVDEANLTGMWNGSETWQRQYQQMQLDLQRQQMAQQARLAQQRAEQQRLAQIFEEERRRAEQRRQQTLASLPNLNNTHDLERVMSREMEELALIHGQNRNRTSSGASAGLASYLDRYFSPLYSANRRGGGTQAYYGYK